MICICRLVTRRNETSRATMTSYNNLSSGICPRLSYHLSNNLALYYVTCCTTCCVVFHIHYIESPHAVLYCITCVIILHHTVHHTTVHASTYRHNASLSRCIACSPHCTDYYMCLIHTSLCLIIFNHIHHMFNHIASHV